jgi:uncharacterized protein (UPF0276 family)
LKFTPRTTFTTAARTCARWNARERPTPLSLHGVGLGLGSNDALDRTHLERVRRAVDRFAPALVSEHACWGSFEGEHFNDLLPLPYTDETVEHLSRRIAQVQDALGRQILVENLSCYLAFSSSRLTEWEFLAAVVERAGCGPAARRQQRVRERLQCRAGRGCLHQRPAS